MKQTKSIAKCDTTLGISALSLSLLRHLLLFTFAMAVALALNFNLASASDINNIWYINALTGSQLVLNGVVNITQGLNVSDGLIIG